MTRANNAAHRTDAAIFAEARTALDLCPTVSGTVRVHVDKGMATLTGTVRLPAGRLEAEDAVRHVKGIRRLVNNITVAHSDSERTGF
jgi:osmotically-inducible protein OsmY